MNRKDSVTFNKIKMFGMKIIVLIFIPLLLLLSYLFIGKGFPDITDFSIYVRWIISYTHAIEDGNYFPYWLDDLYRGYGGAPFLLYGRTFFFLASLFNLFIGNPAISALILACLSLFAFGAGIYKLVSFYSSNVYLSLFTGVIAQISPMVTYQFCIREGHPELLALSLLTWSFIFIRYMEIYKDKKRIIFSILFSLSYVLVIKTHLITAVIGGVFIAIFIIYKIIKKSFIALCIFVFFTFGIGLSANYLLPCLVQQKNIHIEAYYMKNHNYKNNFLMTNYADDVLKPPHFTRKDINVLGRKIILHSHSLNYMIFLIILFLWIIFYMNNKKRRGDGVNSQFAFCVAISLFMSHRISLLLWDHVSILQAFQFPWRWISTASIPISVCLGDVLSWRKKDNINEISKKLYLIVKIILIVLILFISYQAVKVNRFLINNKLTPFSHYTSQDFIDTELLEVVLPKWVSSKKWRSFSKQENIILTEGNAEVKVIQWNFKNKILQIKAPTESSFILPMFYYPNWKVLRTDTKEIMRTSPDSNGRLLMEVPKGSYFIAIYFDNTKDIILGNMITISSLISLIVISLFLNRLVPSIWTRN